MKRNPYAMKIVRYIIFVIGIIFASTFATAQNTMTIKFQDNTTQTFNVSSIKEITWQSQKQKCTCTFSVLDYTLNISDSYIQTVKTNSDGVVKYTSSDPNVASVDASTGLVTAKAEGTTSIIASVASSDTYEAGSASYTITVKSSTAKPESVDLGLSVKWARCNVGAENPEDFGDYFAWGETKGYNSGKTIFTWTTYSLCKGSSTTMTKYCTKSSYGTVDNLMTLESSDDAAAVNKGDSWRMPTSAELTELKTGCYWEWTENYKNTDVAGYIIYKVKSDSDKGVKKYGGSSTTTVGTYTTSDTHIFLPAAGDCYSSSVYDAGSFGYYWSSSLNLSYSGLAYGLRFYSSEINWYDDYRYYGLTVRAVCP